MAKENFVAVRYEVKEKEELRRAAEMVGMDISEFVRLLTVNATSVILSSGEDFSEGEDRFSFVWRILESRRQAADAERVLKAGK